VAYFSQITYQSVLIPNLAFCINCLFITTTWGNVKSAPVLTYFMAVHPQLYNPNSKLQCL